VRATLRAVTGFTVGHSLSLSLAVLGFAHPNRGLVESLIGLTIAIVAVESVAMRTGTRRALALGCVSIIAIVAVIAWAALGNASHVPLAYFGMALFAYCYLTLVGRFGVGETRLRGWMVGVVTVIFGMVHGFGFAGFLLETGLVGRQLAAPLVGFNLGVEIGQLALVIALWLAGYLARAAFSRMASGLPQQLPSAALSGALCGLGGFWFVTRTFR
jgi:hypothetical protein